MLIAVTQLERRIVSQILKAWPFQFASCHHKCQQELDDECPLYESDEMRGTFGGSPSTSNSRSELTDHSGVVDPDSEETCDDKSVFDRVIWLIYVSLFDSKISNVIHTENEMSLTCPSTTRTDSSDLVSGRPLETHIASCPQTFYPDASTLPPPLENSNPILPPASLSDIPGPPRMRVCLLLIFFLTLVLSPTSAQAVADSLRDVWLTAGGSTSYYRGQNPCNTTDFLGVTCTKGIVTSLSLTGKSLNGILSSSIGNIHPLRQLRLIGQLTNLNSLNISSTQMNGQIPPAIGQLQSLIYLQLSHSMFSGPLPSSMGNLYNLRTLNVSNNLRLSGSIDVLQGCTNLTSIAVNFNNFTGEIPPFVFNSSITVAVLADNRLAYPPNVIFSSPSKLTSIQFAGLRVSGDLPSYLYGNLTAVQTLLISNNNIQRLQDNFASAFPSITQIDLGNNNGLTSIPSLVSMKNLNRVELYNNVNLRNLTNLMVNLPRSITYLRLDGTNVEGTLDAMSSLLPNLTALNMNNVRLSGDLSGLTSLYNLMTLSMSKAFQGSAANRTLPASFGSLSQLKTVDLSRNNLIGGIPSSLSQLRNLNTLTLSNNYLNGSVPSFMNASIFPSLRSIDLSNNQFTLIDKNALSGFTNPSKCSVINNPFSCVSVKPLNSSCVMPAPATCTLDSRDFDSSQ
ncbi:hypothetical protein PROFUN_01206 [Planoprotostelium fungivorum]|uniref:Leucine-rich repeat-containing N-terminal plant-type domain-containing protein n=1 Tax=Planoprotostelium fungivorum TaxID=1890364 RepID=A0A2P6NCM0_9EUKA|nr:hypothetical protein PROFUN_01206 [Planoprotostelium fungivorum]